MKTAEEIKYDKLTFLFLGLELGSVCFALVFGVSAKIIPMGITNLIFMIAVFFAIPMVVFALKTDSLARKRKKEEIR